ncbi:hypothetical protein A3P64_09230 [Lactobacillus johnsonii]|uniref:HTH cro/C1-type domain-containing protein n=1 Tax=Lactobacillus johnsonii TaxID=33959 RepID=A0AAX0PT45_LACJH|nr:helix-turn-helix transcriptional regulator [Lactobacillus johnsonii]PAB40660.1 hypothetical protein A3P60_09375 [Lactobacillus johnsonii]PAB51962.1 hypothetical protein A3P64_09230 [Lactobacillus johnsonii]
MDIDIGAKIKYYRKKNKLTMEELANRVNKADSSHKINRGSISKWENKKAQPHLSTVKALAEVFNISIDTLAGLHEPTDTKEKNNQFGISNNDFLTFEGQPLSKEELEYMTEQLRMYRSYKKHQD